MSSKKFKKNRNNNARKNRQLNREGLGALQKCRFFIYLTFVFDILMMFYAPIAHLFGAKETQILYAIMLMIGAQWKFSSAAGRRIMPTCMPAVQGSAYYYNSL